MGIYCFTHSSSQFLRLSFGTKGSSTTRWPLHPFWSFIHLWRSREVCQPLMTTPTRLIARLRRMSVRDNAIRSKSSLRRTYLTIEQVQVISLRLSMSYFFKICFLSPWQDLNFCCSIFVHFFQNLWGLKLDLYFTFSCRISGSGWKSNFSWSSPGKVNNQC